MSPGATVLHDALMAPKDCLGANSIGCGAFSASNSDFSAGSSAPSTSTTSTWEPRASTVEVVDRSEQHTSELQSRGHLVCRLPLEKKKADTLCSSTRSEPPSC